MEGRLWFGKYSFFAACRRDCAIELLHKKIKLNLDSQLSFLLCGNLYQCYFFLAWSHCSGLEAFPWLLYGNTEN